MDFKLIGAPCGQHGPYTFYKAFKYSKHGKTNILALSEFFFVKLWNDSDLVSIGELQLLWEDKNSEQTLASLRLYILPENTPEGRSDIHGEHEVLAITEKVVLRVEDLLSWITEAADWSWGLSAIYDKTTKLMPRPSLLADNSAVDLADVDKEKEILGESHWKNRSGVVVLSYPGYCRYRGILKRLEGVNSAWLRKALVVALGGFTVPSPSTRVLFCKDTFDYPDLEGHELLCNHLAPKLKGRPRKKRKLLDISQDSSDSDSSSESESSSSAKAKYPPIPAHLSLNKGVSITARRPPRPQGSMEERDFLSRIHSFMRSRQTPINRLPSIGYKELDLFKMWTKVRHLGGYEAVTSSRLWKYVFEEVGGDRNNTSAATCCRRHYEKLLLPYERHLHPVRNKNTALAKLRKCDEISITTKTPANNAKKKSLQIRNGSLKREHVSSPNPCPVDYVELSSDDSPVKFKSDVIDLVTDSDDSPVKGKPTFNSFGKKQKLDILKEAGLQVTAVSTVANGRLLPAANLKPPANFRPMSNLKPMPNLKPASMDKARQSIVHPPRPQPAEVKSRTDKGYGAKERVSITITPDVNHMLPKAHAWSAAVGNQNIYGNPKEVVSSDNRPSGGEVLDLRTKSSYAPIGSNLEITLVPPSSSSNQAQNHYRPKKHPQLNIPTPPNRLKPYAAQQSHHLTKPVDQRTTATTVVANGRGSDIVPSVSISVNQKKKNKASGVVPQQSSQAYSPYPMSLDPVYLSAFYSRLLSPYPPTTPSQQVQLYKDLFTRHNIPDSFPRLLQDGSTSISLVNQTPSQQSK